MAKPKPIDYEITCKNHLDYEVIFELETENKFLKGMFGKTLKLYKKRLNRPNLKIDIDKVQKFDIPQKFFILLENSTRDTFRNIKADVEITLLNGKVTKANFRRDTKDNWIISITMGGHYVDKR